MTSQVPPEARFEGFGPAVTDWFVALASDDSRAFWNATRDVWQRDVRAPLEALLAELGTELGGRVKVFRPHRDMRFAPQGAGLVKPQTSGFVRLATSIAARYAEVSIDGFYAGCGVYRFERDQLERYRAAAADERRGAVLAAALAAAAAAGLEVGGETLKTAPRGVPRDHPRVALLRRKGLFLGSTLAPGAALETRAPLDHARRAWDLARPVSDWLDAHVGPSEMVDSRRR